MTLCLCLCLYEIESSRAVVSVSEADILEMHRSMALKLAMPANAEFSKLLVGQRPIISVSVGCSCRL